MPDDDPLFFELVAAGCGRVHQCRVARGLTQEQLAEALAVQAETVSRYETGAIAMSLALLYRVAEVLDVQVGALLHSGEADPEVAELLDRFSLLDAEGKGMVLGLMRRLVP